MDTYTKTVAIHKDRTLQKLKEFIESFLYSIYSFLSEYTTSYEIFILFQKKLVTGASFYGTYSAMSWYADFIIFPLLMAQYGFNEVAAYWLFWLIADFVTLWLYCKYQKDWFGIEEGRIELEERITELPMLYFFYNNTTKVSEKSYLIVRISYLHIIEIVLRSSVYLKAIIIGLEFNPFMVTAIVTSGFRLSTEKIMVFIISYIVGLLYWTLLWCGVLKIF